MKLAEIRDLKPGTALVTSRGDKVTFVEMTTVPATSGRAYRKAVVTLPSGNGIALSPRNLSLAPTKTPPAEPTTTFVLRTRDQAWIERQGGRRSATDDSCVIVEVPDSKVERITFAGIEHLRIGFVYDYPRDMPTPWVMCPVPLVEKHGN